VPDHLLSYVEKAAYHVWTKNTVNHSASIYFVTTRRCLNFALGSNYASLIAPLARSLVDAIRWRVKREIGWVDWLCRSPGFLRYETTEKSTDPGIDRTIEPEYTCTYKHERREVGMEWHEWVEEWLC
jgi:hypothetical protein